MEEPDNRDDQDNHDERVDEIIASYLEAERAGGAESPEAIIARHPSLADELRSFFADRERFVVIAGGPAAPPRAETVGLDPAPAAGDRVAYFGDYEILAEIARGGMGIVYKARQTRLNRVVALKLILSGQLASPADVERFQREAEAAANLDHPNIVPVYEVGEHHGQHYFSMKFVEGGSLQGRAASFRGDPRRTARLIATAARAVDHAHRRGVIHRDLKPGNLLLDASGEPMVVDFGLAKKVEGAEAVTRTGAVVGTPAYMAPEQASAKKDVSTAVDIYSLGAILYECLTGRPPFQAGVPLETILHVINCEPDRPRSIDRSIPHDLETICLKCLEKEPTRRYTTAGALADDLERWLRGEPITARSVGPAGRAWRWCRRNPAVAAMTAVVALALVAGTAVSTWFAIRSDRDARAANTARQDAEEAAATEFQARQQTTQALGRVEQLLYANQIALAQREWQTNNLLRARDLLDTANKQMRGWEWNYLHRLLTPDTPLLTGHTEVVHDMVFSPDGRHLVAVGGYGHKTQPDFTRIWDARTGKSVAAYEGRGGRAVAYRPDLELIATPSREGVLLWNPATGAEVREIKFEGQLRYTDLNGKAQNLGFSGGRIFKLAFSPDGKFLAAAGEGKVVVWTVADGKLVFGSIGGGGVAFSPDGKLIASGIDLSAHEDVRDADTTVAVRVWDVVSGMEVAAFGGKAGGKPPAVQKVAFSPDGKRLASGDMTNVVKVWDLGSKEKPERASFVTPDFADLAFSPDSARLATADRFDRRVNLWDAATGKKLHSILSHGRIVTAVAYSPDGEFIAAAGGQHREGDLSIRLWPAQNDPEVTTFQGHTAGVWSAAFLPDGERIVSTSGTGFARPGEVILWNARTGDRLREFRGHESIVFCSAVSPNGKMLATGSADRTVILWEVDTGRKLATLTGHLVAVMGLAFSPDGRRLVSVSEGEEREEKPTPVEIRIWEIPAGRPVAVLEGVRGMGRSVAFRPDGDEFVVGATEIDVAARRMTSVITLHNASDGKVRREFRLDPMARVLDVDYRPDGKRLAVVIARMSEREGSSAADTLVREFDFVTNQWRDLITARPGGPLSLAYCPDSQRFATGNADGSVKIWDAVTSAELLTISSQRHGSGHVTFSPDGSRLASAGGDTGTVRVWDATAKPIKRDGE